MVHARTASLVNSAALACRHAERNRLQARANLAWAAELTDAAAERALTAHLGAIRWRHRAWRFPRWLPDHPL